MNKHLLFAASLSLMAASALHCSAYKTTIKNNSTQEYEFKVKVMYNDDETMRGNIVVRIPARGQATVDLIADATQTSACGPNKGTYEKGKPVNFTGIKKASVVWIAARDPKQPVQKKNKKGQDKVALTEVYKGFTDNLEPSRKFKNRKPYFQYQLDSKATRFVISNNSATGNLEASPVVK